MLLHMDNFSTYGRVYQYMTNGIYAQINGGTGLSIELVDDPDGTAPGTTVMKMKGNADNDATPWRYASQNGDNSAKMGVAFRYWLYNLPINNNAQTKLIQFRNIANVAIGELSVLSNGAMQFQNYGTKYSTDVPVISANGWYHIEIMFLRDAPDFCTFELRIEGVTVLSEAHVAIPVQNPPQPSLPAQVAGYRTNISGDGDAFYKDLVIWDGLGTTNNDFLGSVLVVNLLPDSDVALNWTPVGDVAGFPILSSAPPDDTKYIQAGTPPPDAYVCSLTDLPLNVTSVRGLMTFVRAGKTDGGDAGLQVSVTSAGVTADGANRPITVSPTYWRDFFSVDPATTVAWTPGAVNAVNLKINRTS
jgi:hypothetical protein